LRLEVGRVGRAHGLQGEVSVAAISNRPERFAPGSTLYVGERALVVVSARPHQGRWLIRFDGIESREAADVLRNQVLLGDAFDDVNDGELWVHELIGSVVRDRSGAEVGRVVAVEANPAHDLLVLDGGALIPVVFVVSSERGALVIDPPEGLLEL
jgi:16S rRNA processing protein RimM